MVRFINADEIIYTDLQMVKMGVNPESTIKSVVFREDVDAIPTADVEPIQNLPLINKKRLTDKAWQNFDPWECCGQDKYCKRDCHEKGGCANGCIVPKLYIRLAEYEDYIEELAKRAKMDGKEKESNEN